MIWIAATTGVFSLAAYSDHEVWISGVSAGITITILLGYTFRWIEEREDGERDYRG
jgi:hypothetical protein